MIYGSFYKNLKLFLFTKISFQDQNMLRQYGIPGYVSGLYGMPTMFQQLPYYMSMPAGQSTTVAPPNQQRTPKKPEKWKYIVSELRQLLSVDNDADKVCGVIFALLRS